MIAKLFKKDIHRNIEGVIKADNLTDEAIFQEVDEYVITNELHQKLDDFFSEYSGSIGKNTSNVGVWISGHFGSGKSHLLKILSYILTNERQHSDLIGELFLEKIEDFELKKNIQKALDAPSQTILFNIDQKSEIGSKAQDDAILGVFMKVFNEMRGYYPKFGYIAKFESDLDKRGKLEAFKHAFAKLSGESWETGRETIHLEVDNFAKALSMIDNISEENAQEVIDKYEENYSLSIEEFAKEVKAYIDSKEPNFRLVFFVDEVGQYIGDNTKLMLNLQTIVETLSTVCAGQAWVVVTSQSAVDKLVKQNNDMENDFSKILGRFKVKLNLTSQNANEVIQKRLLEKTDTAKSDLGAIYTKIHNSLSSIIHFTDRSRQYRSFKGEDDFTLVYPFIPYQMDLFQACIGGLSNHGVFQGRHQSTGERSMLNVVQHIAEKIAEESVGTVATFDRFFDGLASIIRGDVQTQIQKATDVLDPFESRALKTLFMIKYVREFTPNIDNITTLLIDSIVEVDVGKLKKRVQAALNVLKDQKYIQKVGENYEYLTDAEQDIEKEIASMDVEQRELVAELVGWVYGDIIKNDKVLYKLNKQNYPFTRKLDDVVVKGREEELVLNIISPLNAQDYSQERLIHKSMADTGLLIALPNSYEFSQDLETYVKTKKYIPQKQGGNTSEVEMGLLQRKAMDNNKRREKLQSDLRDNLADSPIYLGGKTLDITTKDIKTKIEHAFEELITSTYSYVSMLPKVYEERDIRTMLEQSDDLLTGSDDALSPAEEQIYTYVQRQKSQHKTTTISTILDEFTKRPYGWYQNATLTLLASMFMKQKVDFKQNSTMLSKQEVAKVLSSNREFNTMVVPRKEVDDTRVKKVKELLGELYPDVKFNTSSTRDIYQLCHTETLKLMAEAKNFKNFGYPFGAAFDEMISTLTPLSRLNEESLFDEVLAMEDMLLDCKEDLIDPLMEFMKGEKRKIYDSIREFLQINRDNLRYIKDDSKKTLEALLEEPKPFLGAHIQNAKQALARVESLLQPLLDESRNEACAKLEEVIKEIQSNENFTKVPEADRSKIIKPKLALQESIKQTKSIDTIKQRSSSESLQSELQSALELMYELIPPTEEKVEIKTVRFSSLTPKSKRYLADANDVEEYIKTLKQKLLDEIDDGKQILL